MANELCLTGDAQPNEFKYSLFFLSISIALLKRLVLQIHAVGHYLAAQAAAERVRGEAVDQPEGPAGCALRGQPAVQAHLVAAGAVLAARERRVSHFFFFFSFIIFSSSRRLDFHADS